METNYSITNHPSKTSKMYLNSKNELINDILLWTDQQNIHQFYVDTGCCLEDLLRTMIHMDGCWRKSKESMLLRCLDDDNIYTK